MKIDLEFSAEPELEGTYALEWEWRDTEGVHILGPPDAPPLTIVVRITRLDA